MLILVAVWALSFFLLLINDSESRGLFGDMLDSVSALFLGLAFAGLIIALLLNK